ncbi:MAG TPA: ATP-binding cassette domain-containing protein [Candidatus Paenibacillus intestinavium]|nr:ATP-binding cassette domain-containing protein [Candidatus Paenibacillus intestinavium]
MDKPIISLHGISKSYQVAIRKGGLKEAFKALIRRDYKVIEALKDISFQVQQGEIVGYIGPNGAGKSTTIKIMSGVLLPDSGSCSVMNMTPWLERQKYVARIGVVFGQRSQLWWDVPVIDSFQLLRDIYRIPEKQYIETLEELTTLLKLSDILHTPVRQLSLGQRMRCELAASLLHKPSILFLDEPTIGLDADSKIAVRSIVKEINERYGVTVILTTHDMNDIEALAHRIMMIGKGTLLFDGTLTQLQQRYGTGKIVQVAYSGHLVDEILPGITLIEQSEEKLSLAVNTELCTVPQCIQWLTAQIEVTDFTVQAIPIEELILSLYKEHAV